MTSTAVRFYHDFVDPLSWLVARELAGLTDETGPIEWIPFELRPPPTPLVTVDDASLAERWTTARAALAETPQPGGRDFDPPLLVPWTRKAHELVLHAAESGAGAAERLGRRIREGYLFDGADIGRVDVLVAFAVAEGLDRTETKAVLDVDRHEAEVAAIRQRALEGGVDAVPLLVFGERRLEGFHKRPAIRTFLGT